MDAATTVPQPVDQASVLVTELLGVSTRAEQILAKLGEYLGDEPLAKAVIGSAGIKAEEIREQVPVLREVLREMAGDESGPSAGGWA